MATTRLGFREVIIWISYEICDLWSIDVATPDAFLLSQIETDQDRVRSVIYAQAGALRSPVQGVSTVLIALDATTPRFVRQVADSIRTDVEELLDQLDRGEA